MTALLEIHDLTVEFGRRRRRAVAGLDLSLGPGERLGLIGQSGSGKSVTALAVMGLLPETARVAGSVRWDGLELLGRSDRELSRLRGRDLAIVFQEPMTALDPTMRVGRQVAEVIKLHPDAAGGSGPVGPVTPVGSVVPAGLVGSAGSVVPAGSVGGSGSVVPAGAVGESGSVGGSGSVVPDGLVGSAGSVVSAGLVGGSGSVVPAGAVGESGSVGGSGSVVSAGAVGA
ncbi:MAG: ATP-binding cassette domain-containing protein, partial [Propionibacteriaceae bacterium]|nr:ATP-binding cassette domain-containing protein [Propionibacteriaceae bacterium]